MKIFPGFTVLLMVAAFSVCILPVRQKVNISENRASLDSIKIKSQNVNIIFWNIENLYDTYNDSVKLDDEFTPTGEKHWNWTKYIRKLNHVAKTLIAGGEWTAPALVGLCEVENKQVLNKLIYETPLKTWKYKIVHHDSPDLRGVDVALIYRPELFKVISNRTFTIRFPFDTLVKTREILMVKGVLPNLDTMHVFVNHWPSRRGGYLQSQPRRNFVAHVLRKAVDSIMAACPGANIVIMGDFNDEPEDESLKILLRAVTIIEPGKSDTLYNLMGIRNRIRMEGTLKFRDQWSTFDQFIVSGPLLHGISGLQSGPEDVRILKTSFLVEEDKTYFGEKLKRTYAGPRYQGGFSDHLPVKLHIRYADTATAR